MYRFIQKNNKKLLAVFAAFLMIVFILPSTMNQMGGGVDPVLAKLGDEPLRASEFQAAEQEWKMLTEIRSRQSGGGFGPIPIAYRLGPFAANEIQQNPRLFLLLQREAERMGIGVNADRVNDVMVNEVQGPLPTDRQTLERIRRAIGHMLIVEAAFERAVSVIKVSEPATRHELARRSQNLIVHAVEFAAAAYAEKVPAPTTQQVQAHFQKYAPSDPSAPAQDNPFGFGYRYPNRVKFQYIALPREEVRKSIEASKSPYEWDVEARKYYLQNQSQFPSTQKSEAETAPFSLAGPTTAATRPATTQAAAPASTTRPFEDVWEDAKARIVVPEVERRMTEIQSRIMAIMAADHQPVRSAAGASAAVAGSIASGATSAPALGSSQGASYSTYEYMQRLAQAIQREFKVLPTVAAYDDKLRAADELALLEQIGSATGENGQRFSDYATTAAQPFIAADRQGEENILPVLAPSRPLRDAANNAYLFRITAADPAHAPADVTEVADAVRADATTAVAFEQANGDALKLLEAAKQSGLKQAAQTVQKSVLTVGPFPAEVQGKLPGLELKHEASNRAFAEGAFKLLSTPAREGGAKPVALIALPKEGKLYIAELADVQARPQMAMMGSRESDIERGLVQEFQQLFQVQWFNFDDAKKRLAYTATEQVSEERKTGSPKTPLPRPLPM